MNKSSITHIIVMIIAIAISSWLASSLQTKQRTIAKTREELAGTSMGGFNKFAADIQWMFFINYCGKLNSINTENSKEVYSRLNKILNNDPDFLKAYTMGGLMLSARAPVKSVDILMRGANNKNLKNNSRLPFLAGFVLMQHVKDKDWDEYRKEHKELPDRLQMAEDMFQLAIDRQSVPESHFISSLLRTRAKRLKNSGRYKDIVIDGDQHAYIIALYNYWKNNNTSSQGMGYSSIPISNIETRLLKAIQYANSEQPDNKEIKKTIAMVSKDIFVGKHLCVTCLNPYCAGDKFCSKCGDNVVLFGICDKCGKVMKGNFCSGCGAQAK